MDKLTTSQLKSELKKVGLKVSGKKSDLIKRLTEYQSSQKIPSTKKSKKQPMTSNPSTVKNQVDSSSKKEEPLVEESSEEPPPPVRPSCKDIFYKNKLEDLEKRLVSLQNIPEKLSILNQKSAIIVSLFDNKREIDNWNVGEIIHILNTLSEKNNYLLKKDAQITELLNKIISKSEDKE